ncbi:MAG: hypothetical protein ACTSPM_12285 [Candidatus Heimdallarchaeota archaeon]
MSEKKKTTATKKATTKPKTTSKPKASAATKKTGTAKTSAAKKPAAKKPSKKVTTVKAQIVSYRRSNRLQVTNQAIALVLDDFNHKALVGKKFTLNFENSDATAKGIVSAVHGQIKNKRVRLRFKKGGMAGAAINQIVEIHI